MNEFNASDGDECRGNEDVNVPMAHEYGYDCAVRQLDHPDSVHACGAHHGRADDRVSMIREYVHDHETRLKKDKLPHSLK